MIDNPWYFAQEGRQRGPISFAELQEMVVTARLKGDDLVWRPGMENWSPARSLQGFPRQPAPPDRSSEARPKKKRLLWSLGAVLFLVVGFGVLATLWQKFQSPSVAALVEVMPREARALVILRGLPQLAVTFELWKATKSTPASSAIADLGSSLGLDLSDMGSLLKTGVDVTAPIGMSFHLLDDQEIPILYLPLAHAGRIEETIGRIVGQRGWSLETETYKADAIVQVVGSGWIYTRYRDHLIAARTDDAEAVSPFFKRLLDQELGSVEQAEWFSAMSSLVAGSWHVLGLMDPLWGSSIEESAPELPLMASIRAPMSSRLANVAGLGFSLAVDSAEVRLRYQEVSNEGAEHGLHRFVSSREDRFASRIAGQALGAGRLAIDPAQVLAWGKGEHPEITAQLLSQFEAIGGVDPEREVIPYLGSPLSLAVLRSASDSMPAGFALWLPLKQGHEIGALFEKLAQSLRQQGGGLVQEERGGATWYRMEGEASAGWAVVEDRLFLTFGDASERTVLATGSEGSFLGSIERQEFRENLQSRRDLALYVNVGEVVASFREDLAKNVPSEGMALLENLGEMAVWVDSGPRTLVSEWTLYPARPGGFAELASLEGDEPQKTRAVDSAGSRPVIGFGPRDRARQKRTVADIRSMGTAYMSWLTDQVGAASAGARKIQVTEEGWRRLSPEEVRKDLRPSDSFFYMDDIPLKDGWGHPIEVWRGANLLASRVLLIRSPGRDGTFEGDVYEIGAFAATDYDRDIVWFDGYYARWPSDGAE